MENSPARMLNFIPSWNYFSRGDDVIVISTDQSVAMERLFHPSLGNKTTWRFNPKFGV